MDPRWSEFSSFQLTNILELAFVEGVLMDMGTHLDTRKENQATQQLWEVSLHWGVLSLGCLHLTAFD